MIQETKVLSSTFQALKENYELIIQYGGTYSAKTYSILVALALHLNETENNLKCAVVGQAAPEINSGSYSDWESIMEELKIGQCISKTLKKWKIYKSTIIFQSIDTVGKAKSGKWDITFFNECNHIHYDIYIQRAMRSNVKILDYNPSSKFWLHKKLLPNINNYKHIIKHTNYKDNPTLTESKIKEIEGLVTDDYMYSVYVLGETPKLDGAVFDKVNFHDLTSISHFSNYAYFLDFGFTNDVTCIGEASRDGTKLYVKELIYETGLLTRDLNKRMIDLGLSKFLPIYCDNIPKECAELAVYGWKLIPANKYNGSVIDGINLLKQQEILIHSNSFNFKNEAENYQWIKKDGDFVNIPIDKFNHFWDALRYYAQYNCTGVTRSNNKIVGMHHAI